MVRRDWLLLKSKLEQKFGGCLSLAERFQVLQGLQLRAGESTEDFYDRVSADLYSIEQEVNDRTPSMPTHQLFTSLVFISGLDPDLRSALLNSEAARQRTRLATPEEIRMSARHLQGLIRLRPSDAASSPGGHRVVLTTPANGHHNDGSQINSVVAYDCTSGGPNADQQNYGAYWPDLGSYLRRLASPTTAVIKKE